MTFTPKAIQDKVRQEKIAEDRRLKAEQTRQKAQAILKDIRAMEQEAAEAAQIKELKSLKKKQREDEKKGRPSFL